MSEIIKDHISNKQADNVQGSPTLGQKLADRKESNKVAARDKTDNKQAPKRQIRKINTGDSNKENKLELKHNEKGKIQNNI